MRKIRKRCACGCGEITNYGKMYVYGHNGVNLLGKKFSGEHKRKLSEAKKGKKLSAEHKLNVSLAKLNMSNGTKLKISLAQIKYDPDYTLTVMYGRTENTRKTYVKIIAKMQIVRKITKDWAITTFI